MNQPIKVAITHAGTAIGGAVAAIAFMTSNQVDLYAAYNQLNVVIAEVGKLVAILTPIATGAYAAYQATFKKRVEQLAQDNAVKGVVVEEKIASAIASEKVVATAQALPPEAKGLG